LTAHPYSGPRSAVVPEPDRAWLDISVRKLLGTDYPESRTAVFLRLLYSRSFSASVCTTMETEPWVISEQMLGLLNTIDFGALAVERAARVTNLTRYLRRGSGALWECIGNALADRLVSAYSESENFWTPKGRTLVENFSLFAADIVNADSLLHRDLFELFGRVSALSAPSSGLAEAPACPCTAGSAEVAGPWASPASPPWPDDGLSPVEVAGSVLVETFIAGSRLLDEQNRLPHCSVATIDASGRHRLVLAAFPGGRVSATSLPLEQ
jgi:hypothetical protein